MIYDTLKKVPTIYHNAKQVLRHAIQMFHLGSIQRIYNCDLDSYVHVLVIDIFLSILYHHDPGKSLFLFHIQT